MRGQGDLEGRTAVAVGAVILDKDQQKLLVKPVEAKRRDFWFGKWISPGGKLETGEGLAEGTFREVKDETNPDIEPSERAISFDMIVREDGKARVHVVYIDFVTKLVSGDLKLISDVALAQWFTWREPDDRGDELHEDTQRLAKKSGVLEKDASTLV